jgi:hypothetical protein
LGCLSLSSIAPSYYLEIPLVCKRVNTALQVRLHWRSYLVATVRAYSMTLN